MSGTESAAEARTASGARRGRGAVAGGLTLLAAATWLASVPVAPFGVWYYHFAWAGTLAALAGGLAWRTGRWPAGPRGALSLFFWSAPLWYLFEVLNFRLQNWYYVFVPETTAVRWAGTSLAFTTVVPALYLAYLWCREAGLAETWRRPTFRVHGRHLAASAAAGVGFVALAAAWPEAFFPLVWGAVTLLLEPWNYARDPGASLLGDLSRGRYARIVRLLAGGAFIGVLWELYNSVAVARWIYTVPGLEEGKVFEMPVPGFLGFPVLALDAYVAYRALVSGGVAVPAWGEGDPPEAPPERDGNGAVEQRATRPHRRRGATAPTGGPTDGREGAGPGIRPVRVALAAAVAVTFCAAAQAGVDRWTVDSVRPALADLPGVTSGAVARLEGAGIRRVADLARGDSADLARAAELGMAGAGRAVRAAQLTTLRGMGAENAAALWSADVRSVCDLAGTGEAEVVREIRAVRDGPTAGKGARVRIWLRAAGERCGEGSD